ncbi:MAG: branched-chain amino acid ABC transporter permease [Hyphomicrobiales bacterium]|nr:branched-chain amino acid ABC transporter permease [Hyphomicrobiales bacterium]
MLLFMLSAGLTLIFSMMGVLNFAHASFFMIGAYAGYMTSTYVGFLPGLLVGPLVVGVLGAVVERYGLRRVHKLGHVAELLFTFGLAFLILQGVQMIWGVIPVPYQVPDYLNIPAFTLFETDYPAYRLFMLLTSIAIFLLLFGVLTRTRVGLIIQAALTHPEVVGALGHNVPRIFMLTFGVGCALAGLAGVMAGPVLGTEPSMAGSLGSIVFVVVVVGGMGSLGGALIASLLIGIVQTFAVGFDYSLADLFSAFGLKSSTETLMGEVWGLTISSFAPMIPYLLMVLLLIFRPRGLMGTRES